MKGVLHHVELYVSDLKKTKEFWGWLLGVLGYEVYQSWEQGISYKLGATYLVFVQVEQRFDDVAYHRCRAGINHLAFHGESRAFVDEITMQLRKRGVTILYEDAHPYAGGADYYAVYFEDVNRMKVEIVADE